MKPTVFAPLLGLAALAACNTLNSPNVPPGPDYDTFQAQGDSSTIAATLTTFRAALGGQLNAPNTPPADSGRREINWDGVPAALTNVDTFPATFFNVNSKRGVVTTTPGRGLRVDSSAFVAVNVGLGDQLKAFSPKKLFMAVGSNKVRVDFQLVGTTTAGLVRGFGVVLSDVDRTGSTRVEFFDSAGFQIASLVAPAHQGAHEFSFIGAVFASPVIARVLITSGDAPLTTTISDLSAGGSDDLVAMDDFIYGEPRPRQ
jgi:hypothetical protein